MALINCPECNREVSDKAEMCPNCGFGVAKYVERQRKILKIQEEAEKEAYLYVKQKKKEEKERAEREKRLEEDRKNSIYNEAVSKYESESSKDVEKAAELFLTISSWKDSDIYLSKCKYRISELKNYETIREEKCKRRNKKIIFATAIALICVGLIIGGYNFYKEVVVPRNIYESAMNSIQCEDYEGAVEKLSEITEYKDAKQQIEIVVDRITENKYFNAEELIDEQKYSDALDILIQIKERKDVDTLINKCEDALKYEKGVALLEAERYEEAIDMFLNNDFDKNNELLKECYIGLAHQKASDNNYGDAIKYFKLADYQGEEYWEVYHEMYYERGKDAFNNLDFKFAIVSFKECLNYKDSAEMLQKSEEAVYIDDEAREKMKGCWYKSDENTAGGRVIVIDASEQSQKLWTAWGYQYTFEYVKENQEEFKDNLNNTIYNMYKEKYDVINNGDGTYSALLGFSEDNKLKKIRFFTFKLVGDSLKIISYPSCESDIGIYKKVK